MASPIRCLFRCQRHNTSRVAHVECRVANLNLHDPMEPNDHSYQRPFAPRRRDQRIYCSPSDIDWFKVTLVTNGLLNLSLVVRAVWIFDMELYGTDFAWVTGFLQTSGQNESIQQTLRQVTTMCAFMGTRLEMVLTATQTYQLSANAAEVRPPGPLSGYITNDVSWSGVVQSPGTLPLRAAHRSKSCGNTDTLLWRR